MNASLEMTNLERDAYRRFERRAELAGWQLRLNVTLDWPACAFCGEKILDGGFVRPADENRVERGPDFYSHPLAAHYSCLRRASKVKRVIP